MSEPIVMKVMEEEIDQKANPFDVSSFYSDLKDWLNENGFTDSQGGSDYIETFYYEDVSTTREIYFNWRTKKETDTKYINYKLNIDVHIMQLKKIETVINGRKVTLDSGEVVVNISSEMNVDLDEVKKTFLGSLFYNQYLKRWVKPKLLTYKNIIKSDTLNLISFVKKFFELPGEDPSDLFNPPRGIK